MNDPLAKFRSSTAGLPPALFPEPSADDSYVAFGAKDRVERLKIKRANSPTHAPGSKPILTEAIESARHSGQFTAGFGELD